MTHHPDQIAQLAHLRHAEHLHAAAHRPLPEVAEKRPSRLHALRRLSLRRKPVYVREWRIASS